MEAVVGLLVMLLGVSHGVETYCDGRQNNTQCYGALGGTVVLRLMDDASETKQYKWTSNSTTILNGGINRKLINLLESRSSFTPSNGTFRINSLSRTEGGEYKLEIFDSNGKRTEQWTLQLIIEAPVSSVRLVPECLSNGELRVSCSSEGGDSPQYSWTLDGRPLTDAQLLSGNSESSDITVRQDVSGQLVCSVRNHVSNVSQEMTRRSVCVFLNCTLTNGTHISQWVLKDNDTVCIEPTTTTAPIMTSEGKETEVSLKPSTNITSPNENSSNSSQPWYISNLPTIAGVLSALVILLVIGVVVIYAHKKKQNSKPKDPAEDNNEQDLTYADVRIVKRPGRQVQQRAEAEVEYGQVKFTARPRQTAEPAGDDCTYAIVRHGR